MSKILLLGSTGLLGQAILKEIKSRSIDVLGVALSHADVCMDISDDNALVRLIKNDNFSIIINACAIVNHQLCEDDKKMAYQVNARPSSILTNLAKEMKAYYILISTDGYYAGDKDYKHKESNPVLLLNEYARTKYCGECFTLSNSNNLVVRTNIVGFRGWQNQPTFVEWVISSLRNKAKMILFNDYYTSSISVAQFSKSLMDLIIARPTGIINLAGSQVSTKAEFIRKLAKELDFDLTHVEEGTVNATLGLNRPNSLGLDVFRAEQILGYKLPGLNEVLQQLKKEYCEMAQRNFC